MKAQPLTIELDPGTESLRSQSDADWIGNNAAFVCPVCRHVYIVTGAGDAGRDMELQPEKGKRVCPNPKCGQSVAYITEGGRKGTRGKGRGRAWIDTLADGRE